MDVVDAVDLPSGGQAEILTELGQITPKEIWEDKEVWLKQIEDSKELWNNMTDEKRDALVRMVTSAIERMHDRADEWVPEALEVEGGSFLDVKIRFLFTDIDRDIERNEQATSFQIKAAAEQTVATLQDMETETEKVAA